MACLLWTSPAWKMQARDKWIGWSEEQRRGKLQRIVNNGRFLILPWVHVQGLASKILALSARHVPRDLGTPLWAPTTAAGNLVDASVFAGPATVLPTAGMWGKPPGEVVRTASIKLTVMQSKISTSIRWCATSISNYAVISRGKPIPWMYNEFTRTFRSATIETLRTEN